MRVFAPVGGNFTPAGQPSNSNFFGGSGRRTTKSHDDVVNNATKDARDIAVKTCQSSSTTVILLYRCYIQALIAVNIRTE